jgi:hypothetical protein
MLEIESWTSGAEAARPKPVGGLDDRDSHAAASLETAREQGHENHQAQTVRPDRHHDPVEQDVLPK